ncbi:MAG: sugar ABC transporter permease [Armatimonadota bacterium]|nr:sugar ABC transporter permease [Armatimonadota bacterium]
MRGTDGVGPPPIPMTAAARLRQATPYLLAGIPILLLFLLVAYPMLYNVNLSVRSYRTGAFVGLHNFVRVFDDPLFAASLKATGIYVVLAVGVEIVLGLALALFIHRTIVSATVRSAVYLLLIIPMVTPPVVAGVIARLIYTPNYGILNHALRAVGLIDKDILWLSTGAGAMFSVLSVDIWQWTPFVFLVCFAGFTAVPIDVAEAARVDGAGGWSLFRLIELPYLKSLLLLLLIFRFTDTFRVFDHVLVLTAGGPGASTEFISVYLYRIAFKFFDLGYAAAIGFYVVMVTSLMFSLLNRWLATEGVM